jgi:hypothetical protein
VTYDVVHIHKLYLGLVLVAKLLWNPQIKRVKYRTIKALMVCKGVIGLRWPAMLRWIYTTIVRPRITYATVVWCHRAAQTTATDELQKVLRSPCFLTTRAMKSALIIDFETMQDLFPLPAFSKKQNNQLSDCLIHTNLIRFATEI